MKYIGLTQKEFDNIVNKIINKTPLNPALMGKINKVANAEQRREILELLQEYPTRKWLPREEYVAMKKSQYPLDLASFIYICLFVLLFGFSLFGLFIGITTN